jgi:tetratricopeptide (TPR) repeat protein
MPDLVSQAVAAALAGRWEEAVCFNNRLLKKDKNDVDCLNRLGRALLELGDNRRAATIFRRALKIDRFHPVSQKNLARALNISREKNKVRPEHCPCFSPAAFLEEPGKTKLVTLVNPAPAGALFKLKQAEEVKLLTRRHAVIVTNLAGDYLGALPDDLGHRLFAFLRGGNQYKAFIKSAAKNSVTVLVREVCRAKKFLAVPSFPAGLAQDYPASLREETLPKPAPETGDEDDAFPERTGEEEAES